MASLYDTSNIIVKGIMSLLEENALFILEWLIWYSCYTDNFSGQNGYQINRNALYSIIRIANYKPAEIVDIDGTFYMYMYKATCK